MTSPDPQYAAIHRQLRDAVAEASRLALSMFRNNVRAWNKDNASPVTEADLAVDNFMRERLTGIDPAIGWLSEETVDVPERLLKERVWIVDPIDGTRSFIAGREDWAICAALVERGRPVAAVVEVPATGESFAAIKGGGTTKNGQKISVSMKDKIQTATIAYPAKLNPVLASLGNRTEVPRIHSIAVRLSRVASGEIDAALAAMNANDWDLAAADLLVHEAGGRITDVRGRTPVYNLATHIHGALIAAGSTLHPKLVAALAASLK
ncbi:MAG: 3'(2'),5'-bisphosphate nucleotidase CysQ [Xanthobacteraceae bacterium]|nr:3'(2'),5'-bisphosphate nucleotidase CysQ [Xanthobacteraceae bacterium]MCW5678512.1 3'(2'),5'-bisphosphate nucleotidase CysQ [Xanthobacteraceae bacterium]